LPALTQATTPCKLRCMAELRVIFNCRLLTLTRKPLTRRPATWVVVTTSISTEFLILMLAGNMITAPHRLTGGTPRCELRLPNSSAPKQQQPSLEGNSWRVGIVGDRNRPNGHPAQYRLHFDLRRELRHRGQRFSRRRCFGSTGSCRAGILSQNG